MSLSFRGGGTAYIVPVLYHALALATPALMVPPEVFQVQITPSQHSLSDFFKYYQPGQTERGIISHRGPYGVYQDVYLPESSLQAGVRGFERFKIAEVDAVPDKHGVLIAAHDLDRSRPTRYAGAWGDTVFEDLPADAKEYVLHKIENDAYTDDHKPLGIFLMTIEELLKWTLACEPGITLIMDTRMHHAVLAVKLMVQKLPYLIDQVMIQVYNFGFTDVDDYVRQVTAHRLSDKWQDVNLVVTASPGHFAAMAGIPENVPDHERMLASQIEWLDSFLYADYLNVRAVIVIVRGGWPYYDPQTKTVNDPDLGYLTQPKDVTPFALDWVGKQLLDHVKEYTSLPVIAPANTYAVKKDGKMYIDGFHKGNLKHVDPKTPFGRMFMRGGSPEVIYGAGVDLAIADNPELFNAYLDGEKIGKHAHLDYPPHNYEKFGL